MGFVGEKGGDVAELDELILNLAGHGLVAVADADGDDAAEEIEVLIAVGVPDMLVLGVGDDEGLLVVMEDGGEKEFFVGEDYFFFGQFRPFYRDNGEMWRLITLVALTCGALMAEWAEVQRIGVGEKVEIGVRKAEAARGGFVSASETAIVVRHRGGERTIARAEVRRVRVADPSRRVRNGVIGTAIGTGVGAAIGLAVCPFCPNEGHGGLFVGPAAAIGAGIGAAAGLLPMPYRTVYRAK